MLWLAFSVKSMRSTILLNRGIQYGFFSLQKMTFLNYVVELQLTLLPTGGGGGIFIPHHHSISCHSETTEVMAPKLCDFLFLPFSTI